MAADDKTIDFELVQRAIEGDDRAFRTLVEKYQSRVYSIAYGVLRNQDAATDATQDAFVRVYRNLESFKGDSSFYTWIYRIVVNLCIDKKRRQKRQREVDYDDALSHGDTFSSGPTLATTSFDTPAKAAGRKELIQHLNEALETLSEDHRAILVLREIDGLAYDEISEILDIPQGTVMSRLFHARRNFQRAISKYLNR